MQVQGNLQPLTLTFVYVVSDAVHVSGESVLTCAGTSVVLPLLAAFPKVAMGEHTDGRATVVGSVLKQYRDFRQVAVVACAPAADSSAGAGTPTERCRASDTFAATSHGFFSYRHHVCWKAEVRAGLHTAGCQEYA